MQPLEIVIVALQLLDQHLDIGLGQHVLTHEVGDRAHGLHGDGLVEEIQRLAIATQSQCLAEGLLVRAEAVELLAFPLLFQPLFQSGHLVAKAGEVAGDGEGLFGHQKQSFDPLFGGGQPAHLGQGYALLQG